MTVPTEADSQEPTSSHMQGLGITNYKLRKGMTCKSKSKIPNSEFHNVSNPQRKRQSKENPKNWQSRSQAPIFKNCNTLEFKRVLVPSIEASGCSPPMRGRLNVL